MMAAIDPFGPTTAAGSEQDQRHNSLLVEKMTNRSIRMAAIQIMIRPFRPKLTGVNKAMPPGSPRLDAPRGARKKCAIDERMVDDIWIYDFTPKSSTQNTQAASGPHKRVYYFSGGGWQAKPSSSHWAFAAELSQRLDNCTISLVSYPLAPHTPASKSMPQLRKLYDTLMEESTRIKEKVIFAGDSSGGNIALCLVIWALQIPTSRAPAAILGICPSTDLRHERPTLVTVDERDPLLTVDFIHSTARAWCGGSHEGSEKKPRMATDEPWTASDPRVSPILADLKLLKQKNVHVHGLTATYDVLSAETVVFRDKLLKEGITGKWSEWEKQMHCFPLAFSYGLPECKEAVTWIVKTLNDI